MKENQKMNPRSVINLVLGVAIGIAACPAIIYARNPELGKKIIDDITIVKVNNSDDAALPVRVMRNPAGADVPLPVTATFSGAQNVNATVKTHPTKVLVVNVNYLNPGDLTSVNQAFNTALATIPNAEIVSIHLLAGTGNTYVIVYKP